MYGNPAGRVGVVLLVMRRAQRQDKLVAARFGAAIDMVDADVHEGGLMMAKFKQVIEHFDKLVDNDGWRLDSVGGLTPAKLRDRLYRFFIEGIEYGENQGS